MSETLHPLTELEIAAYAGVLVRGKLVAKPALRGTLAIPDPDETNDLIEQPREAFAVTDFKSANWVAQRIKNAKAYAASVKAWATAETKKAVDAERHYMEFYGLQMAALVADTTRGTDKKSINVPAGRIGLRAKPLGLEVANEQEVLTWALLHCPEVLKLEATVVGEKAIELLAALGTAGIEANALTISKSALLEWFRASGDVPPGCDVRGGEDALYVQ